MRETLQQIGEGLADYLTRPRPGSAGAPVAGSAAWQAMIEPCDVLLVEGSSRVAGAIKYLTQSTWSHAALCVQLRDGLGLVEADMRAGVRCVPLDAYALQNVRLCRPVGLSAEARRSVVDFALDAIGQQYDLRNVFDLARWLLPEPPVPRRFRRRLLALGSGEPTRAICSTLIARAFQSVGYPILPEPDPLRPDHFRPRHASFTAPRDFDLSPYFAVVKPTLDGAFDPAAFPWARNGAAPKRASGARASRVAGTGAAGTR